MNIIKKLLTPEEIKTTTCRWCGGQYEFTDSIHPELPWCWRCTAAALEKYAAAPPRIREKKPFVKL